MSAQTTINNLKTAYTGNRYFFDLTCSTFLAGEFNKYLRQEIIQIVTGELRPLSKCSLLACSDALKNSFDQLSLF